MVVIDQLSCPACGNPFTEGKPCNLTCRRVWLRENMAEVESSDEEQKAQRFLAYLEAVKFDLPPQPTSPNWIF